MKRLPILSFPPLFFLSLYFPSFRLSFSSHCLPFHLPISLFSPFLSFLFTSFLPLFSWQKGEKWEGEKEGKKAKRKKIGRWKRKERKGEKKENGNVKGGKWGGKRKAKRREMGKKRRRRRNYIRKRGLKKFNEAKEIRMNKDEKK